MFNSSISDTNRLHVRLCLGSSRPPREVGEERPLRPVAALVRSGLGSAVPCLAREQEERERHQEAVGEVRLSVAANLFCFFPTTFAHKQKVCGFFTIVTIQCRLPPYRRHVIRKAARDGQ